ncbi:hypothetical protein ACFLXD_07140 [Chloroflexota bacterium]
MQIRKTYQEISPELLYAEIRDFVLKQGASLSESRLETYTQPDESASFISRGTIIFKVSGNTDKECLQAHIVGTSRTETKLMLDIDEKLFSKSKVSALLDDVDFIFSSHEVK